MTTNYGNIPVGTSFTISGAWKGCSASPDQRRCSALAKESNYAQVGTSAVRMVRINCKLLVPDHNSGGLVKRHGDETPTVEFM